MVLDGLVQAADRVAAAWEVGAGLTDGGVGVQIVLDVVVVVAVAVGAALSRVALDALPDDVVREVGVHRSTAIALSNAPVKKYNQSVSQKVNQKVSHRIGTRIIDRIGSLGYLNLLYRLILHSHLLLQIGPGGSRRREHFLLQLLCLLLRLRQSFPGGGGDGGLRADGLVGVEAGVGDALHALRGGCVKRGVGVDRASRRNYRLLVVMVMVLRGTAASGLEIQVHLLCRGSF